MESKKTREFLVFRKNGCTVTLRGNTMVFHAPYLGEDGLEAEISKLVGLDYIMDVIPGFHERQSLDLRSPESGLVPGLWVGKDREMALMAKELKRYVELRKSFPSQERFMRWLAEVYRHDGRVRTKRDWMIKLIRLGEGVAWIKVKQEKSNGHMLIPL